MVEALEGAVARVIDHVAVESFAEFIEFFRIKGEVVSGKYILDVRLVLKAAGGEDEDKERTEEDEDLKTHVVAC